MIVLTRIDNRLIHGQVLEVWVPQLHIQRLWVIDDEAATNPLTRAAMTLAVPAQVEVRLEKVQQAELDAAAADPVRTLLLVRDVEQAAAVVERGLPRGPLNLGNVHAGAGRHQVSRSVFLSDAEVLTLRGLATKGMNVSVQALPTDKPISLETLA